MNDGNVRTLEIFIHLKGHHYNIFLEDKSIGSGLYTAVNNHNAFRKYSKENGYKLSLEHPIYFFY